MRGGNGALHKPVLPGWRVLRGGGATGSSHLRSTEVLQIGAEFGVLQMLICPWPQISDLISVKLCDDVHFFAPMTTTHCLPTSMFLPRAAELFADEVEVYQGEGASGNTQNADRVWEMNALGPNLANPTCQTVATGIGSFLYPNCCLCRLSNQ